MNDAKKKVSNQKAETEKDVKRSTKNGSILPLDTSSEPLFHIDPVTTKAELNVVTFNAPSGNVFVIGDTLQVVIGDKAPIRFALAWRLSRRDATNTGAVGVASFVLPTPSAIAVNV